MKNGRNATLSRNISTCANVETEHSVSVFQSSTSISNDKRFLKETSLLLSTSLGLTHPRSVDIRKNGLVSSLVSSYYGGWSSELCCH